MLTKITLHGALGEQVGKIWNLAVQSVGEAIRAIEILSEHKLYPYLLKQDKKGCKYRVLINEQDFESPKPLDPHDLETIKNSELVINFPELRTIDIVPVIEGADSNTLTMVAGAILIVAGVVIMAVPGGMGAGVGVPLIIAGLGLMAAGVINLLSQPPNIEDFREIGGKGSASYMFSGPQNVTREGGPVPIGYGRMLVGSQVIAASYEITHKNAADSAITV